MPLSNVSISLKTEYSIKDQLYWNFLNFIPFLIGLVAVARDSTWWLFAYICIYFLFLIIQLRFSCTHCLHHLRSKGHVKCMMLPGIPKILKDRPGPHTLFEKAMSALGVLTIFLFPLYWLIRDPLLVGAYIVAWSLFFLTARRYGCTRCINFKCPMNAVQVEIKNNFKKKHFKEYLKENFEKDFKQDNLSKNLDFSGEKSQILNSNGCSEKYVSLKAKHEFKDFLYWNFITLVLLSSAGIAIGIYSTKWLLAYIFLVFFHFYMLEQRFFCTHCPYYSRNGKRLKCMMNWGWPKYFRPRPFPPSKFDLAITSLGFIIVIFFPLPWLLKETFLLGAYLVSISVFLLTIWRYECSHCIYFGCPFNRVPVEMRKEFEGKKKIK